MRCWGPVPEMSSPSAADLVQVRESDHVLGAAEPELTLIEYGDFGCPFCFVASRPLASLLDRYPGLRLVWRHLPDPELHPGADLAAELSELAAASGKFWDAYALLLVGRARFSMDDLRSSRGLSISTRTQRRLRSARGDTETASPPTSPAPIRRASTRRRRSSSARSASREAGRASRNWCPRCSRSSGSSASGRAVRG